MPTSSIDSARDTHAAPTKDRNWLLQNAPANVAILNISRPKTTSCNGAQRNLRHLRTFCNRDCCWVSSNRTAIPFATQTKHTTLHHRRRWRIIVIAAIVIVVVVVVGVLRCRRIVGVGRSNSRSNGIVVDCRLLCVVVDSSSSICSRRSGGVR